MGDDRLAEVKARRERSQRGPAWLSEWQAHAPDDIDWLVVEVERLAAEVERRRGRLRELEWAGNYWGQFQSEDGVCPVCGNRAPEDGGKGHSPDCWLAEAIGAERDG